MIIETAGTIRSKWGEGPIWWNNSLYYVDIENHLVIGHLVHGTDACFGISTELARAHHIRRNRNA